MKKRILSLLLVFAMVFSLIPSTALAVADTQGASAEQANPFADVKETDWFYDAVQYARVNGFFSGTSKTTFEPNGCSSLCWGGWLEWMPIAIRV